MCLTEWWNHVDVKRVLVDVGVRLVRVLPGHVTLLQHRVAWNDRVLQPGWDQKQGHLLAHTDTPSRMAAQCVRERAYSADTRPPCRTHLHHRLFLDLEIRIWELSQDLRLGVDEVDDGLRSVRTEQSAE